MSLADGSSGEGWWELAGAAVVSFFGWLLLQVWRSKPSRDEMMKAIADAVGADHLEDEKMLTALEARMDERHRENQAYLKEIRDTLGSLTSEILRARL